MRLVQSCCCVGSDGSVGHGDKWQEQNDSLRIREKNRAIRCHSLPPGLLFIVSWCLAGDNAEVSCECTPVS